MYSIKYCEKSGFYYLIHYSAGKKTVVDKSFSKTWINLQYCKLVGDLKKADYSALSASLS